MRIVAEDRDLVPGNKKDQAPKDGPKESWRPVIVNDERGNFAAWARGSTELVPVVAPTGGVQLVDLPPPAAAADATDDEEAPAAKSKKKAGG